MTVESIKPNFSVPETEFKSISLLFILESFLKIWIHGSFASVDL